MSGEPCPDPNVGTHVDIPPRLWATVAVLIVLCLAILVFVARKGWMHYELVEPEMMHGSFLVSTMTHGLYRILVFAWCFSIWMWSVWRSERAGRLPWDMRYFTAWGWVSCCVVFFLLTIQHVFTFTPKWVSCVTWSLYQVTLTNAIFLDVVAWSILWPQDPDTSMPQFFITLNVHAFNAVFLLGELALSKLEVVPGQIGWNFFYAIVYIVIIWINYTLRPDCMPYSFLRVGPDSAPAWYVGLVAIMSATFSVSWALTRFRDRCFTGAWRQRSGYERIV